MSPLEPGSSLTSAGGHPLLIERLLETGARGTVCAVQWRGRAAVLTVPDHPSTAAWTREKLADLVDAGAPGTGFLWPLDFAEIDGAACAIMPPRPPGFAPVSELLLDLARHDLGRRALLGRNLALSVARLHLLGYALRDFALRDLLVDPADPQGGLHLDVAARVAADGEPEPQSGRNPRYLAPELLRGEALPGVETDLHTLATAMFMLLFAVHPLDGRLSGGASSRDADAQRRLCAESPRFVFHPQPQPGQATADEQALGRWLAAPKQVRQCFGWAFTRGLQQPGARPSVGDWCVTLTALLDALYLCARCGALQAFCPVRVATGGGAPGACPACGATPGLPPRLVLPGGTLPRGLSPRPYPFHAPADQPDLLVFPERIVMLVPEASLHAFHTVSPLRVDFQQPTAKVVRSIELPGQFALLNDADDSWVCVPPGGGDAKPVGKGRSVLVQPGAVVDFGGTLGSIVG